MVKNTIETLRCGAWAALALAMLALVMLPTAALAGVVVSPATHRVRLGDNARPLSIRWKLDGVFGELTAKSPSGSFLTASGAHLGTAGSLLEGTGKGFLTLTETLTVPPGIVAEAHRRGLDRFKLVRTFHFEVAYLDVGEKEGKETGEITVILEPARTTVADPPSATTADPCAPRSAALRWEITAEGTGPLDVESSRGVFFASGDRLAAIDQLLSRGRAQGKAILQETLTLGPELAAAARSRGVSSLQYVRSFTFRGAGGFAATDEAWAVFGVEAPRFEVSAELAREALPVDRAVSVPLTWSVVGEPCSGLTLTSQQGWFQTPAGVRLGQPVLRPLALRGSAPSVEVLAIPVEVSSRALQLDSGQVEFVREFRDLRFETSPVEGKLLLDLGGSASARFAVHRLALRFRGGEPFQLVSQHDRLQAIADVIYTGSGLLQATWEVADPGSTLGQPVFRPLQLERTRLTAGGDVELISPELPTGLIGGYRLRLRITDPNLAVGRGPASRFELPVVEYQVGAGRGDGRHPTPGTTVDIDTGLPNLPEHVRPVDESGSYEEREVVVLIGAGERSMEEALREAAKLKALGYTPKQRIPLDALGLVVSVLRVPREKAVPQVVDELRGSGQWADANHVFMPQTVSADCGCVGAEEAGRAIDWRPATRSGGERVKIGLIDTPVDLDKVCVEDHKAFSWRPRAAEHGTRVASLLIGDRNPGAACSGQRGGLAPNAKLYVAEAVDPQRGTTLVKLLRALDWLVDDKDIALVLLNAAGPDNLLLEMLLELTLGALPEEIVLVAPYGRRTAGGGQLFPADYASVFGVVAVKERASCNGPLPGPGSQALAAPGPGIELSSDKASSTCCSDSCAAPFVIAALSLAMDGVAPGLSRPVLRQRLRQCSEDLNGISLLVRAPESPRER